MLISMACSHSPNAAVCCRRESAVLQMQNKSPKRNHLQTSLELTLLCSDVASVVPTLPNKGKRGWSEILIGRLNDRRLTNLGRSSRDLPHPAQVMCIYVLPPWTSPTALQGCDECSSRLFRESSRAGRIALRLAVVYA